MTSKRTGWGYLTTGAWIDIFGGRKTAIAVSMAVASGCIFTWGLDARGAAELAVLLSFWAGLAGVHGATNVAAKRAVADIRRAGDPGDPDDPGTLLEGEE